MNLVQSPLLNRLIRQIPTEAPHRDGPKAQYCSQATWVLTARAKNQVAPTGQAVRVMEKSDIKEMKSSVNSERRKKKIPPVSLHFKTDPPKVIIEEKSQTENSLLLIYLMSKWQKVKRMWSVAKLFFLVSITG